MLDWQIRDGLRGGVRGRVRLRLDRRVAPRRVRYRGLGLRPDDASARAEAGPRSRAERAFAEVPFAEERDWPRISVVVCSYNGARTIRDTLEALQQVEYPDFEVIVVDDGSTDATAAIAARDTT